MSDGDDRPEGDDAPDTPPAAAGDGELHVAADGGTATPEPSSGWDEARSGDESNAARAAGTSAATPQPEHPAGYHPAAYQPPAHPGQSHYAYPVSAPQQQPYPGQPGQYGYPPQPGQPVYPGTPGMHGAPGQPGQPPYSGHPHQPQGAYPVSHAGYAPGPAVGVQYGHPAYVVHPSSGLAITSLVLSLLGLFTCGLTAIAGLICGHVALSRTKREPQRFGGHGMALAGTIIGYVIVVGAIALVALIALSGSGHFCTFDPNTSSSCTN